MATSKTLTPTNVTIQIPEFTDQPDQRVNSNCLDKEADAINALNSNLALKSFSSYGTTGNGETTMSVVLPEGAKFDALHPLLVMCAYRGSQTVSAEGCAVVKVYNNVLSAVQKLGMSNAADFAYNSTTRTLSFTTSAYMSCVVIGSST